MKLMLHPLTPPRWPDLESVFQAQGCSVARGCWCMYYRSSGPRGPLPAGTTQAQANRAELLALVNAGRPPGLIGYRDGVRVGWVSLGPLEDYAKLQRCTTRRVLKRWHAANRNGRWFGSSQCERAVNNQSNLL